MIYYPSDSSTTVLIKALAQVINDQGGKTWTDLTATLAWDSGLLNGEESTLKYYGYSFSRKFWFGAGNGGCEEAVALHQLAASRVKRAVEEGGYRFCNDSHLLCALDLNRYLNQGGEK
ncbi:hypothetical protein ISS42_00490 [Candidatus Shapirobacteria bacterium]|nr:hypothetical protein [Candidatus Shapirobacteria bacterium]